jgi:molecular chaperone GrpE
VNAAERQDRSMPVVRDILPALDGLQRALQVAKTSKDVDQLLQGMQMVTQQFEDALGRHSVVAIKAVGEPFDPNMHEAIQQAPSKDHPPMTVLHEVERGYQLFDRVVRPTKVIVSVKPAE